MTPESDVVRLIIDQARENLKNFNILLPTFFLGRGNDFRIVGTPFDMAESKHAAAQLVQQMAQEMRAEFVVFVTEAWVLQGDQAVHDDFMNNREKYPDVRSHPDSRDMVFFHLETATTLRIGVANVLEGREMGVINWQEPMNSNGPMVGFMGQKPVRH